MFRPTTAVFFRNVIQRCWRVLHQLFFLVGGVRFDRSARPAPASYYEDHHYWDQGTAAQQIQTLDEGGHRDQEARQGHCEPGWGGVHAHEHLGLSPPEAIGGLDIHISEMWKKTWIVKLVTTSSKLGLVNSLPFAVYLSSLQMTCRMECFLDLLDLIHTSMFERAHRRKGRPSQKIDLEDDDEKSFLLFELRKSFNAVLCSFNEELSSSDLNLLKRCSCWSSHILLGWKKTETGLYDYDDGSVRIWSWNPAALQGESSNT